MELKSSAEKKKHLGGILRIFAKSVRDAAKSLSVDDLPSSEDKLSSSSSQESSAAEKAGQKGEKNAQRASAKYDNILNTRSRSISENEKVLSEDHEHFKEQKLKIPKTVSLDHLENPSRADKENQPPSIAADMEDWGSDLLDVETSSSQSVSTEGSGCHRGSSDSLKGGSAATSNSRTDLTVKVKSEGKQKPELHPDVKIKKLGGHRHDGKKIHRKRSFSKGSSACDPDTETALVKVKEIQRNRTTPHDEKLNAKQTTVSESVSDAGKMLEHLSVRYKEEKRERQASVFKPEHPYSNERRDRFKEEKRQVPASVVKPEHLCSPERRERFEEKKRERQVSPVKPEHPCSNERRGRFKEEKREVSASVFKPKHLCSPEKRDRFEEKKRERRPSVVKPEHHCSIQRRDRFKDEKKEVQAAVVKPERRGSTGFLPPLDEDWSSELLDTSSCSSITSKDELNEAADTKVSKQLQCVSTVSREETEKFPDQIPAPKETDERSALVDNEMYLEAKSEIKVYGDNQKMTVVDSVLYSDERAGREAHIDECDSLDITLTRTGDEDWSTDLMSVPSSKNASPQAPEVEDARLTFNVGPESGRYLPLNVDHLAQQFCSQENTLHLSDSEQEPCSEEMKRTVTNFEEKDDSDPTEYYEIAVASQTMNTVDDVFSGFVDDISDIATDHEPLSDLESQAPSTLELVSANDDTICSSDVADSYDLMTQDEDYDHFPSFCTTHQSQNRHDLRDKERPNSDRTRQADRFLYCHEHEREEACSNKETTCTEKLYQNSREQEDKATSQKNSSPANYYPFLCVPLESVKSRESVEGLMTYIDSHMQNISLAPTRREETRNVWFNIEQNHGRDELKVGFEFQHEHVSPMYPAGAYPWAWPCNPWTTYPDTACPRYDIYDPCLSPNTAYYNHYFERFYGDCQRDYLYPYKNNREGSVHKKMPLDEHQLFHQQYVAGSDNRIVDYDSSSEDERLAMLTSKRGMTKNNGNQTATAGKKSYASCVMNNNSSKRSLLDPQGEVGYPVLKKDKVFNALGNKMQRLGAPKQARVLLETCLDRNKDIASDPSAMYELSGSERCDGKDQMIHVDNAKKNCGQSKSDFSANMQRRVSQGSEESESWKSGSPDPKFWAQFRRNRNIVDSFELDDSFETNSGKENVEDEISDEEEVKSPGCYPYLTIGKVMGKSKDKSRKSDGKTPPLISPAQWAAWATEKNPVASNMREQAVRNVNKQTEDCNSGAHKLQSFGATPEIRDIDERSMLNTGQISSPPVMPVCPQPFWGDPRMAFPYPAYYPSHWVPGFPGAFPPGYLPYQSPPSNTSSPTSTPASSTSNTAPRSTTATFPYQMTQYATARSRTLSAPSVEVDKLIREPESVGEDKSCKNYFLAGKNRRVSDSVLRSDAQTYTPKRSSYASRLQNDARLNANFPQLDWKIRFKSRCRNYAYSFIDSHCHLDFLYSREGFKGTFAKYMLKHEDTFPENFEGCVAVFCNPATFLPNGGLWKDLTNESKVWLTMGCHPKMVTDFDTVAVEGLKKCIQDPRIIAVGEIGLDYSGTFRQHEELQKKMFAFQLQLALDVKKPLVIHCRQAEEDCLAIMEQIVPRNYKIHCHCFTGSYEECEKWLNKFPNLYIGLTNLVSFRSASPTHDVARHISLSRLLLETDTPYFVPRQIPKGEFELSHPGMAVFVAEEIARIKQIPVNVVLKACRNNTKDMYGV